MALYAFCFAELNNRFYPSNPCCFLEDNLSDTIETATSIKEADVTAVAVLEIAQSHVGCERAGSEHTEVTDKFQVVGEHEVWQK